MAQGAAADGHVRRQLQKIATCHAASSQGGGQFAGGHELIWGTMNAIDVSAPALCTSGDWSLSVNDCAAPRPHDARRHAVLVGPAGLRAISARRWRVMGAAHGFRVRVAKCATVPAEFTWRSGARIAVMTWPGKDTRIFTDSVASPRT